MTVGKLAAMHSQHAFIDFRCDYDINSGGPERRPVRLLVEIELDDCEYPHAVDAADCGVYREQMSARGG